MTTATIFHFRLGLESVGHRHLRRRDFDLRRATSLSFHSKNRLAARGDMVFFLTLASPIDALADGYLFSAHMLQHLLLLLIVPPLILLSLPPTPVPPVFKMAAGDG